MCIEAEDKARRQDQIIGMSPKATDNRNNMENMIGNGIEEDS